MSLSTPLGLEKPDAEGLRGRYNSFFLIVVAATMLLITAMIAVTYIVDPYAEAEDADGIYFATSPATIPRYRDLLAREPHVLVFGTSRSRLISDRFVGDKVINFHALYGWPKAVLTFLEGLDEQRLRNVHRVIYLLDQQTFAATDEANVTYPTTALGRLAFRLRDLRGYTQQSFIRASLLLRGGYRYHIDPRGFTVEDRPETFDGVQNGVVGNQSFDPAEIARLADIKAFGDKHGIPIEFITPVMPVSRLKVLNRDLLFAQRRGFVNALGAYFEMTYIPGISDDDKMFADSSHINSYGTQKLYALYPWKDRLASRDNIESFLDELSRAARR